MITHFPTCPWCGVPFTTPEARDRHVVTCPERPAITGRRRPQRRGER